MRDDEVSPPPLGQGGGRVRTGGFGYLYNHECDQQFNQALNHTMQRIHLPDGNVFDAALTKTILSMLKNQFCWVFQSCSSHPARQGRSPENGMEWCLRHDQTICVWNLWTGSNSCLHRKCCPGHRRSKMESILDPTTYCQAQSSHRSEVYWQSSKCWIDACAHLQGQILSQNVPHQLREPAFFDVITAPLAPPATPVPECTEEAVPPEEHCEDPVPAHGSSAEMRARFSRVQDRKAKEGAMKAKKNIRMRKSRSRR